MKRDRRLHGLSSDHHHALLLARELTQHVGPWTAANASALVRRFEEELEPHFRVEEELMLPALRAVGESALVEEAELFPACETRLSGEVMDAVGRRAPK